MNPGSAGPEQASDAPTQSTLSPEIYSPTGGETPRAEEDGSRFLVKPEENNAAAGEQLSVVGNGTVTTPTKQSFSATTSNSSSPLVQQPHRTVSASQDSYFAPRPLHFHSAQLSIPEDEELSVVPSSHTHSRSPSILKSTRASATLTPEHVFLSTEPQDRPTVHRDYSTASTISNASTIRASDINSYLPLSQSKSRDLSYYPNQAHSALSNQYHPTPPSPHYLRSRSNNSSPYAASSAAPPETHSPSPVDTQTAPQPTSREASSTASSPGLFTPKGTAHRPTIPHAETVDGTYASPYLHHTHRQMPKETHLAEIDFDPISGRKVINQYEVIDELGRGVHGKVKLGRNLNDGTYVAIKIVERYSKRKRLGKNNSHEAKIKKEIAILKKARHHNIVGLLEVIDDPMCKKVYIILEHVEMGEIAWRIEGAPEICSIEYRRAQRESAGDYDHEAAQSEDEHFLDEAHKHVEKHDRRKWRKIKQQRLTSGDVPTWSLEYGDDDDDEYSNSNMSRIPSATTSLSQTGKHVYTDNSYPRPDQTVLHYEDASLSHYQRKDSDNRLSDYNHSDSGQMADLAGTMYGPYDVESIRGRTPSVAGSLSSTSYERDLLERIPENFRYVPLMSIGEARRAFRDTVLGLEYLHYQGVVHRDIKPANLLQAATGHIKISDFGVSYLGKEKTEPFPNGDEASEYEDMDLDAAVELAKTVGTPAFYAPELCQTDCDPESEAPPVTHQIDIWALGVTLYCLVFGRVPFYDENTFHLMRMIAEEEAYIPRQRLKAVDLHANSRPSSHARTESAQASGNKRLQHELVYEDIDDELTDILRRMLTKDPRRRITLNEIKHHGWLVQDIQDKVRWLDETDPNHFTSGRRIEISKEDVDVAVVPLTIVERAKSVARKVGEVFGIASKKPSSRKRAESTATNTSDRSNPVSAASSSSTISQDARRQRDLRRSSLKPSEDSIFSAFKASSSHVEHPLSQSVTASPEPRENVEFLPGPDSAPDSPMSTISQSTHSKIKQASIRPSAPDRAQSTISATGSIRTVRPGDLGLSTGATTLPALPSTPLEMNTPSSLGGIFGGAKQKLLSTVRNARDRSVGRHGRASPIDRVATSSADPHSQASLAVSDAMAAGQVTTSSYLLDESTTASSVTSAVSSRNASISSNLYLEPNARSEAGISRNSSLSSIASRRRGRARTDASTMRPHSTYLPLLDDIPTEYKDAKPQHAASRGVDDLDFARAKEEQIRRRIQESQLRPASTLGHSRGQSLASEDCPPSPDDETQWRKEAEQAADQVDSYFGNIEPLREAAHSHLMSSSSEDHLTGMSQSTSNPSIPSVASADSSVQNDGAYFPEHSHDRRKESQQSEELFVSSDQAAVYIQQSHHEDHGYDGDHAVESDEDDDSDDSFVEMTRHKSRRQGLTRSESISNAELARHRERRPTEENHSIKSARSGSNNTMKKVRSRNDTEDES
jgi:serine/threonine protein kinase